jgi:hypothetical protein
LGQYFIFAIVIPLDGAAERADFLGFPAVSRAGLTEPRQKALDDRTLAMAGAVNS